MPNRLEIDIKHSEETSKELASVLYRYIHYTKKWREEGGFKNRKGMMFYEEQAIKVLTTKNDNNAS